MPKVIQPRRHDKELSVEEFWKIKNEGKQQKTPSAFHAYRQNEVENRHRYQNPSEQAKNFNPLALTLRPKLEAAASDLYLTRHDDDDTCVAEYLADVQYKLNPAICEVKKWTMGRQSILYNLEKIYALLWANLHLDQTWHLLQAVIRDSKGVNLNIWLQTGLKTLSSTAGETCASNFSKPFFKNLFDTICVFMQTYYEPIVQNLQAYFQEFSGELMKHQNKYIRKFSVQSFSYLLGNLSQEQYQLFLNYLIRKQTEGFFDNRLSLADLLLQRLKIVKGCLTTASMTQFLTQLQTLQNILEEHQDGHFVSIASEFIGLLLDSLNCRQGVQDTQLLFDFVYVVKALIAFKDKHSAQKYGAILVRGFSKFLASYNNDKKKFTPNTPAQSHYLKQVFEILGQFFTQNVQHFEEREQLSQAVATLTIKCASSFIYNSQIIAYCKQHQAVTKTVLQFVYEHKEPLEAGVMEVLMLLSREILRRFITADQQMVNVYTIIVLMKRFGLQQLIELAWLGFSEQDLCTKLQRAELEDDLIVALRFIANIRIPQNSRESIIKCMTTVYSKHMTVYEQHINSLSQREVPSRLSGYDFYNCANFTREIILYAHHEIGWLGHIFNVYQSFTLLAQHLQTSLQASSSVWDQLIISRPSALSMLSAKGRLSGDSAYKALIINLLSSRNREVRHSALEIIVGQFSHPFCTQLLNGLLDIDSDVIDLENEREVKRTFCNIEQHIQTMPEQLKKEAEVENLYQILLKWCLGFAFTGFKLIETAFISFLKTLLQADMHPSSPQNMAAILMPFLHYYNYRHSRQYEYDVSDEAPVSHLTNAFPIATNQALRVLVSEDLQVTTLDTVEWIGLQRVAEAVRSSKNCKKHLSSHLAALMEAYFQVQFRRQSKTIQSLQLSPPKAFLLGIKVRFLVTVLKLCPGSFLPPVQCLHFTREVFFEIEAVRHIKRNNWQSMWQRRGDGQAKKKNDIAQIASTTINLEHLSAQEQRMYVSYLWKDILESNRHKKRIIMDHLRNYLPTATPLLFRTLFNYLHLSAEEQVAVDEETVNRIVGRLRMMNRKSLLNGMFIMKAMLIHLKQEIASQGRFKVISLFILSLIQIVYTSVPAPHDNNEEDAEQELIQQQEEEQQEGGNYFQYKQHRKQLQKLLQTLFSHHQLQVQSITELLEFLFVNTKINLAKSARLSVPGLLHILKIVSAEKEYCEVLARALNGDIISMLTEMVRTDENNERPLRACFEIWMQVMNNLLLTAQETKEQDRQLQSQIDSHLKQHSANILSALLTHINGTNSRHEVISDKQKQHAKRKENESLSILRLIARLLELQQTPAEQEWEVYIWDELGKLGKVKKNMTAAHCEKLSLLILVLSRYIRLSGSTTATSSFLKKIISVLPNIKDPEQRLQILQLMIENYSELGLKEEVVALVSKMGQLKKTGLIVGMDYPSFFEACNEYTAKCESFNLIDHEYYLFNLLCFADHEELSVRRAVSNCCKSFLPIVEQKLGGEVSQMQEQQSLLMGKEGIELVLKLYRAFLDMISKQSIQQNEQVFWNIVDNIDLFFTWFANHSIYISSVLTTSNVILYAELAPRGSSEEERSYLKLMASISEASKLKGLKLIRSTLQGVAGESRQAIAEWSNQVQTAFPNPVTKILLPITEYLILKPTDRGEGGVKSNLSSTFAKQGMELLPLLASFLNESSVKRELKRLISKLRFSETESKRNIAVIRMLGALIDGVPGEKVSEKLHSYLQEHGFEQFHQKITQFSKSASSQAQLDQSDDSEEEQERVSKKQRVPGFFERLEQLQSEEAINRNFLQFDRKMMQLQMQEEGEEEGAFPSFLKKHVLLPLRTMLMKESRGKAEEQNTKSQVLLSVTITKVLLRLPLDLFLREFQKVISRLGRLLKKRESEVRENARTCLCQIARSVGPQLLYAIIIELKFHLRDNFDRHVLNFSIFKVLEALPAQGGAIDYCLPLVLPSVVDEIFGQSAGEKEMVERHEVRTLKVEAKKQKGLQILQVVCRAISADRIGYIIDFLEKYLRDHLVTEVSLGKYDHMLGAINAGLAHNAAALDTKNTPILLPTLAEPVSKLREQIRQLSWQEKARHENTVRKEWRRVKAGREQMLTLQEEAGRNRSIFKKMSKEIGERRNQEIIASSLIQFYLALLSFFLKRQVFTLHSVTTNQHLASHFLTLLGFLGECVDQRDNRLVTKSLKTLHIALGWNTSQLRGELQSFGEKFKSIRKQTSRKILLLVQQLTLADEDLLRECFVFLNDLVSESAVTLEMLPSFVSVIKLHTPTTEDQPHLPETYQLLRTLLYKCPQYLYHPLLDELRQFVRLQLPTCRNKQLRDLASSILAVYLRPKSVLEPSVQAYNQSQGKHERALIDYSRRLHDELTFYLSNLESPGQEGVLQLLEEFVNNREAQELESYAELLLLGLMTARTNQVGRERAHAADGLIVRVLKGVNAGKVGALIEKALLWAGQARGSSIRFCGASFLKIILQHANIRLTLNFIEKYVLSAGGMLERATGVLLEEAESLQASRKEEQGSKKLDTQWNDILNDMEVEESKYQSDPSVIEFLTLISHLLSETTLASTHSKSLSSFVLHCWQLLHSKETALVEATIACLLKTSLLPALRLKDQALLDPKHSFSAKKVVGSLIFNRIKAETIEALLLKIVSEEKKVGQGEILAAISWLFVGLALKAHIKPNIYQAVLPTILHLLLRVSLHKLSEELDFRSAIFGEPNFQEKLLQLSVKLGSNPLIAFESKTLAEQVTQVLKEEMGVAEYFRAVGEYEVNKRNKKEQQKVKLAEMAILNPAQYIEEKRGRKKLK